jgi:hypothetical protein
MRGREHYREADAIVTGERCDGCGHEGCPQEMARLARAQVHATLALAAATVDIGAGTRIKPEPAEVTR